MANNSKKSDHNQSVATFRAKCIISFAIHGDGNETTWYPGDTINPDDFSVTAWESLLEQNAVEVETIYG